MALRSAGGVYGLLPTVIGRICFESQVNKWFAYVYEGYAKRPSKQNAYSEGLWVDHVERYPLKRPTANPCVTKFVNMGIMEKPS
jgi:hypothetical protein